MIRRRESRDTQVVLAALGQGRRSAITRLGLTYLTGLPEDRVASALVRIQDRGLLRRYDDAYGVPASGTGRVRFGLARPARDRRTTLP